MTDIRLERDFTVSPERLFVAITSKAELVQWWGPEGMSVSDSALDFSAPGPWFAVLKNAEGQTYKMSGQVTHVNAPRSLGLTWGWHDDKDARGAESFVTLTVVETAKGAKLIIEHRDLADDEIGARHEQGWTSSLNSLAAYVQ